MYIIVIKVIINKKTGKKMKDNNFKSAMPITAARRAPASEKAVKQAVKGTKYMEKTQAMAVSREPYYHHMPKDNPATATLYAFELGGKHHDISKCDIL